MATQTKPRQDVEYATERVTELNERVLDTSRKATGVSLDAYERTVKTVADFEDRLAVSSQNEWVASMIHAHADLAREISKVQTSAARGLLK